MSNTKVLERTIDWITGLPLSEDDIKRKRSSTKDTTSFCYGCKKYLSFTNGPTEYLPNNTIERCHNCNPRPYDSCTLCKSHESLIAKALTVKDQDKS